MRIIYPSLPYEPQTVDPLWQPEYEWARANGMNGELFDLETNKLFPRYHGSAKALYRGWMLSATEYSSLAQLTPLLVTPEHYLASHHATGWYNAIREFTFPSVFQTATQAPDFDVGQRYFVKGLVKSFGVDSVVTSVEQWQELRTKHELTDDEVLFVRQFAELKPDSEQRFFVVAGAAYGACGAKLPQELLPVISHLAAQSFYSLDVARTIAGAFIVVEVGDGQVSDLKEWPLSDFGDTVLRALAATNQP
jgi:hypothetical protein